MAEAHPVGFQWVMEAKKRGATVIHVDPRFTRTSALADLHVPIRAGTDIAFLGGLIRYVLETGAYFEDYVRAYTNGPMLLREDFADTEDLDGLFSGFDPETATYDTETWQYDGATAPSAAGDRDLDVHETERGEMPGSGGAPIAADPERDDTMQDPRCVLQVLRRHYSRYTPEKVHEICGIPVATFHRVAEALVRNSGRDRTSAFAYAVGWTHHTVGVQYIRAASVLQALLGNIGRPGGGILALRGHASIQGSTDIPTLFDLLPGYIPMPHAHRDEGLQHFIESNAGTKGFWADLDAYVVSLLKAWFGDAATADNDFYFDHLPRLTGDHSSFRTVMDQVDGKVPGYFVVGENPAVGTANARMQRHGLASLEWLVVRDLNMIETATFWKDGPEIETGEMRTEDIGTEIFFLPAAAHTEKDGTFTNTQRLLQWHHKAVEPPGDCRSDLWFYFELGRRIKARVADSDDPRDRPLQDLTWDYPVDSTGEPSADAVLREINGVDAEGRALPDYTALKADGSTSSGCWIYCGVYADGVNRSARRRPGAEQDLIASEWGWAWPMNRRVLYNRASADPDGNPWSERKRLTYWDGAKWAGPDVPDFPAATPPDYVPPPGAHAAKAIGGAEPFVMQADGRAWLHAPAGLADGPMPTHYEPEESPVGNALYGQRANPARQRFERADNPYHPEPGTPGAAVYPYVFTTFRVTEHHTAGGMSRWTPYLNELQPEMFLEVSPELAAERGLTHGGWAHVVTARSAIEGRVLVTERAKPLRHGDTVIHQIGVPWHWGPNGLSTGDAANELLGVSLDPNVHIMETKAATCDIRPGRRPRGPELVTYLADRRRQAGLEEEPR